MRGDGLLDKMELIDPAYIEAADAASAGRKKVWAKWGTAAACLCLVITGAAIVFSGGGADENAPEPQTPETAATDVLPGGIRPEILIGGTSFYWVGMAQAMVGAETPYEQVYTVANAMTYLPEGYTEYGNILETTADKPAGDCQMMAGFEAVGTIYTSASTPNAAYILMSTDWFENDYIRFVSAELDRGYSIVCSGRTYRLSLGGDICPVQEELPDACEYVGELRFIGIDAIPENHLETNCPNDTYSFALEGRGVFLDPDDPEYLYVYEKQHRRGGEYDAYLKCPLLR